MNAVAMCEILLYLYTDASVYYTFHAHDKEEPQFRFESMKLNICI